MLGGSQILRRLESGELFADQSWRRDNIRGASYDLRMGRSRYVIVRTNGNFVRVSDDELTDEPRVLHPGDFALVSSEERLLLGNDIAGSVGAKFDFVRKGVLVLTGVNVDPGYGSNGDAQPLHFLLANMSKEDRYLVPGVTKVATIQFHQVARLDADTAGPLSNFDGISHEFFDPARDPALALDLFSALGDLRKLEATSAKEEIRLHEFAAEQRSLDDRLSSLESKVDGLTQGANQIILFGVILLGTTLAGVVASVLLQGGFLSNGHVSIGRVFAAAGALALFGVGAVGLTFVLLWLGARIREKMTS